MRLPHASAKFLSLAKTIASRVNKPQAQPSSTPTTIPPHHTKIAHHLPHSIPIHDAFRRSRKITQSPTAASNGAHTRPSRNRLHPTLHLRVGQHPKSNLLPLLLRLLPIYRPKCTDTIGSYAYWYDEWS